VTLRIGIIGCGFIGTIHSLALRALVAGGAVDARVVATCDADVRRAEAFARPHGAGLATTDAGELLAEVDAVWICTPTATHPALVAAAAGRGVAVFCEKPLAVDLPSAARLVDDVAVAGVAAQVGLVLRSAPAMVALHDLVQGGSLGRPMAVVFRDDQYLPTQGQYASTWRGDVAQAGGGTLLEHSIHDVDVLRWLLGDPVDVSARTACMAGLPGIEDVASVTLTFASGATASLTSVWHQVLTRPSSRRIEVLCEDGLAWIGGDEWDGPLEVLTGAGLEVRPTPPDPDVAALPVSAPWRQVVVQYAPQANAFLRAVRDGTAPRPDLATGLAAHRLVDAAYRSAAAGGHPVAST
jgi:predicted dehydrogenase